MGKYAALFALAASFACSHNTLPGTEIEDTPQTRAVLDVFTAYRNALQSRDPKSILALTAPSYFDNGDPGHALSPTDYAALPGKLQHDFEKVTTLRLEATIKDIEVKGNQAHLDYFQVLRYSFDTPTGEKWKTESDDARMKFVKVGNAWKISSGL